MTLMKHASLKFIKTVDHLNAGAAWIARAAVLLMLAIGFWNVVGRHLGSALNLNLSSNGLIEAQWYLFDVVFLLGLGWTLQKQGHVRVDVLAARWPARLRRRQEKTSLLLLLLPFAFGVMAISMLPALHSLTIAEMSPDPGGLPRSWVRCLIPVGFLLLALQGVAEWLRLQYSTHLNESPSSLPPEGSDTSTP